MPEVINIYRNYFCNVGTDQRTGKQERTGKSPDHRGRETPKHTLCSSSLGHCWGCSLVPWELWKGLLGRQGEFRALQPLGPSTWLLGSLLNWERTQTLALNQTRSPKHSFCSAGSFQYHLPQLREAGNLVSHYPTPVNAPMYSNTRHMRCMKSGMKITVNILD